MFFRLAWRNIWRNPRRTAVILTALIIGIWSMVFLGALMRGMADQMVRNGIATLTGHLQIHQKDFRADPVIEHGIADPASVAPALTESLPPGANWTPRIRLDAVVANARHSGGATLVGIDPRKEARVSFIGNAVKEGRYLEPGDRNGIVVGKAFVDKFETKLGRKLVLMCQDTQGEIASRAFRIVGIFRAETDATEKQFVFVSLSSAREMLKLGKEISEIAVLLPERREVEKIAADIRARLPSADLTVNTWKELLPMVTAMLRLYNGSIFVWYLVVFVAMAFGIVNTTLMAVFERMREFGLLKALGMKPGGIVKGVLAESFLLIVTGMIIGNALSFLTVFALSAKGIDLSAMAAGLEYVGMPRVIYPMAQAGDVIQANLVVLVLGLLVSLYPASKAARFLPVEALAHT
ncbi:MAG: ABC transporter permease [Deltaproteobacteria bacterium]|nr:ABC transporter permease [Deltaproteobacteria bacterium]MBW2283211.1 ABC transporter permease [Deltaproteobacteria bacterium]